MTIVLVGLSLFACKEKLEVPTVLTNSISTIEQTAATGGGEIVSNGGSPILNSGICWNTTSNPTINNSKTTDKASDNLFISKMTNLQPSTTYYVRAYAVNSEGVGYGPQVTFKTLDIIKAEILLQAPENVTSGYIERIRAEIVSNGGSSITESGFVWGMKREPTVSDNKIVAPLNGTNFSTKIDNLQPDSTYFIRAYAINQAGVSYSTQYREVKMLSVASAISILKTDSITDSSAKIIATATSGDNFNPITERGIHWTIKSDSIVAENHVVGIATKDEFITYLNDLAPETKYYLMPYAKNKYGLKYGAEIEIVTKAKATEKP